MTRNCTVLILIATALVAFGVPACSNADEAAVDTMAVNTGSKFTSDITVTCNNELGIDSVAATRVDWNDEARTWKAEIVDTTLVLTRTTMCGDECGEVEQIVLANLGGDCPRFVSATVRVHEDGSRIPTNEITARAALGTLEIQDWNAPAGVVSGRLESEVSFTFYAVVVEN